MTEDNNQVEQESGHELKCRKIPRSEWLKQFKPSEEYRRMLTDPGMVRIEKGRGMIERAAPPAVRNS